jgi:hypothetical protein
LEFGRQNQDYSNRLETIANIFYQEARAKLIDFCNNTSSSEIDEDKQKILNLTLELYDCCGKMSPLEIKSLALEITKALKDKTAVERKNDKGKFFEACNIINKLCDLVGSDEKKLASYLNSSLAILRLASKLGVNIKNYSFEPGDNSNLDEISFSSEHTISITPAKNLSESLQIEKYWGGSSIIYSKNNPKCFMTIENNSAILIGRPMAMNRVYNIRFENTTIALGGDFESACFSQSENSRFSRGGLLLIKYADRIFIFDSGSTNKISFEADEGRYQTFLFDQEDTT